MAVKPWPQITMTSQAVDYIAAEMAEAQQYCPAAVTDYNNAYVAASAAIVAPWSEARASIEALLTNARKTWHDNECTKTATVTGKPVTINVPPTDPNDDAGWANEMQASIGGVGAGFGTIGLFVVGGVLAYLLLRGKKGGGKRRGRKSAAKRGGRSSRPRRRR